jgi:hypothetical protein
MVLNKTRVNRIEKVYTMHDYVAQLLEDIEEATHRSGQYFRQFHSSVHENEPDYLLPLYRCEGLFRMCDIFGISRKSLPEDSSLCDLSVSRLALSMERLWNSYHFYGDFPNLSDARLRYKLMRDHWDKEVKLVSSGESHIEFCHHCQETCRFNGFCSICSDLTDEN